MAERITSITMQAFRGVRGELTFEFPQGRSGVILGENATGKSTVADALEWYFTGDIDLLRHEGRAGSLRHIAAIHAQPTSVTVLTDGTLGGTREIGTPVPREVESAGRETFILRGRTLTAFVERTKGEKWKALADILGLEQVDQLRLDLQTVRNDARAAAIAAENECASAVKSMQPIVNVAAESELPLQRPWKKSSSLSGQHRLRLTQKLTPMPFALPIWHPNFRHGHWTWPKSEA